MAHKKTLQPSKKAVREPVTRDRALRAAMALADERGLDELSMRTLAESLGIEAMSLYHHLKNKGAVLDGMVDLVFAEVEFPRTDLPWKAAVRSRMVSLRSTLLRHQWALRVLESRANPGLTTLAHHDAMLGCFRSAGFSIVLTGRAYALLDSYVFGFVHTELSLPFQTSDEARQVAGAMFQGIPEGTFPHLVEFALARVMVPGYSYGNEFDYGLDLILDGLERALKKEKANASG
ncbi:MAG: TetR/AcrR family transcriptional regulator C-terminal domain-containing protein [Polyangiaceae bacterium]|nr:TetR/AcrR family transcriptional regulator C-terminal domain-containing protein [Polyangiaceae bacterium]